jgi:hypothetical protein
MIKGPVVEGGAFAIPDDDATSQDALHGADVKVSRDLRCHDKCAGVKLREGHSPLSMWMGVCTRPCFLKSMLPSLVLLTLWERLLF